MKSWENTEYVSEDRKAKKSVTGFSRLEYILGFKECLGIAGKFIDQASFRFSDAYSVVKEVALSIEAQRHHFAKSRIDVSKLGYGSEEQKLEGYGSTKLETITKTAISGLRKWELIKPISVNTYSPLEGLRQIGRLCREGKIQEAKTSLYHYIIRKEHPFSPRRFLIRLRDYKPEKVLFTKPQLAEMPLQETGGIAYADDAFIEYLQTNSWAMTVMSDWGSYFELTDWFPETFIINNVKFRTRMLVLTKRIASLKEMEAIYSFEKEQSIEQSSTLVEEYSRKSNLNKYAVQSILKCAERLGLLKMTNSRVECGQELSENEMINKALIEKVWIIADADEYRGIISDASSIPPVDANNIFVLFHEEISLETFYERLYDGYVKSAEGKTYQTTWIHKVRKEVCKSLHINWIKFDQLLTKLCIKLGAPYVELAKVSIKAPADLKPFIFMGGIYHLIKVRKK
jgi:hypothetical protein